jgi:hypothetical protein
MTTRKTIAVVEGLTKRDIQPNKRTERGALREGTDGVCEEGEEGGGPAVRRPVKPGSIGTPTRISQGFARPLLQEVSPGAYPPTRYRDI